MENANKYRVIDEKHPKYGKIVTCVPSDDELEYIDVNTGEKYQLEQVMRKPEKHAVYFGLHGGRWGLFLYGREFIKYHSYQLGVSVDWIKHDDAYLDLGLRILCFEIGIRFLWLSKTGKLYGKIYNGR